MTDVRGFVAIVGSTDQGRTYDPPLRHIDQAGRACEELGRWLAVEGFGIIAYSSSPKFIEHDVVRGFAGSGKAAPRSIQVRSPFGGTAAGFGEARAHSELFDIRLDSSADWEVSYYRSLVDADGILLVGGGLATYITGLIALAFRIPLVAVAPFGGNGQKVWQALDRVRNDAGQEDVSAMAADWSDTSAKVLVGSFRRQQQTREAAKAEQQRRSEQQSRQTLLSLGVAALLLLLALATIPLAWGWRPGTAGALALLTAAPLLSATCGAIIRNTLDEGRDWTKTAVLGCAAGAMAFLFFVAAQIASTPNVLDGAGARRLLFFVLPIGFIAGLTFDAVYSKLRTQDVTRTSALDQF
jgi:hypothetical protein